jgi:phosphoribosyl 1,2-cyclic phosphate phosphodiesterase
VSRVPSATLQKLYNLDLLIVGALRHTPHPTHFNLTQALELASEVKPRRVYFTHLCHDVLHAEVETAFGQRDGAYFTPLDAHLAYDGLEIEL